MHGKLYLLTERNLLWQSDYWHIIKMQNNQVKLLNYYSLSERNHLNVKTIRIDLFPFLFTWSPVTITYKIQGDALYMVFINRFSLKGATRSTGENSDLHHGHILIHKLCM